MRVLEDIRNLENLTKDELYGILTPYKMRTEPENVSRKVVVFKVRGKTKSSINECEKYN